MTFLSYLYTLIIGPLELFFEVVFALAYKVVSHPGAAIVVLSLAMNFLVLPLYMRADKLQAEQMAIEKRLQPWIKHIKRTFKGDERFMMLQTFYRQNEYKPTDALKGSISLLLEIPFFIAAYRFLSGLELMKGVSMGPIADLGKPDALIVIGTLTINLLPVLMTLINIVSSAIYTKGMPLKAKLQLYVIALIFLVFLYNSPAGLVFYWTLNNLFSLCKNICYKLVEKSKLNKANDSEKHDKHEASQLKLKATQSKPKAKTKVSSAAFYIGCLFLALFEGLFIPVNVIKASPAEFIDRATMTNPLQYVANSAVLAVGFFVLWFAVFYKLATPKGKDIMGCLIWILSGMAVVNFMLFGKDLGNMSALLVYDTYPESQLGEIMINLLAVAAVATVFTFLWKRARKLPSAVLAAAVIAVLVISVTNIVDVNASVEDTVARAKTEATKTANIPLSKTGKNVVVIMLDRAISSYVPYIMNEDATLKGQFAGFTYYPNTISYGMSTNIASPALYGGYEYTPEEINKRDTVSLKDKQNESLLVMPVNFSRSGYTTTVWNPTYANYEWIPDTSIYDDYSDINVYLTGNNLLGSSSNTTADSASGSTSNSAGSSTGKSSGSSNDAGGGATDSTGKSSGSSTSGNAANSMGTDTGNSASGSTSSSAGSSTESAVGEANANQLSTLNRNLFCYGIFRTIPVAFREISYDTGLYNNADSYTIYTGQSTGSSKKKSKSGKGSGSSSEASEAETSEQTTEGSSGKTTEQTTEQTAEGTSGKTTGKTSGKATEQTTEGTSVSAQVIESKSKAHGINTNYKNEIEVLENLSKVTHADDNATGTFFMMSNESTHEVMLLQEPDYSVSENVDNTEYDAKNPTRSDGNGGTLHLDSDQQLMHYQCNMAALKALGKWFDYLRENGLYDNTRIIIVSDHGRAMSSISSVNLEEYGADVSTYNPVLLVKDFNSTEYKTDNTFMTNADTPTLAMNGLVSNPTNPSTGKKITNESKMGVQKISTGTVWEVYKNNGNTFLKADWLTVHDNIFIKSNWGFIKEQ